MASEHGNRQNQKEWFMAGYNEMLRRIDPEKIICYNTPFPEMQGNIVYVDYERSGWKYMSYEREKRCSADDLEAYKIGGQTYLPHDTMAPYLVGPAFKGGGSAYGGKWRPDPNKPNEVILKGPPNSIQKCYMTTRKGGYWVLVKYNSEGWATKMRHFSDHGNPSQHTNPHDKEIEYDPHNGTPVFGAHPDIQYPADEYPDGPPEFKAYPVGRIFPYDPEAWRFQTISEFKWCMAKGGEVQFEWNGIEYSAFGCVCPAKGEAPRMMICQSGSVDVNRRTEKWYDTADDMLDYMVGGDRLRDVITRVTVCDRTI